MPVVDVQHYVFPATEDIAQALCVPRPRLPA